MCAVGLKSAVARASQRQQFFFSGVVATDEKLRTDGVCGDLVPQPLDAVVRGCGIVEIRVSQVEANVHDAHHNPLARVGLRQPCAGIGG